MKSIKDKRDAMKQISPTSSSNDKRGNHLMAVSRSCKTRDFAANKRGKLLKHASTIRNAKHRNHRANSHVVTTATHCCQKLISYYNSRALSSRTFTSRKCAMQRMARMELTHAVVHVHIKRRFTVATFVPSIIREARRSTCNHARGSLDMKASQRYLIDILQWKRSTSRPS